MVTNIKFRYHDKKMFIKITHEVMDMFMDILKKNNCSMISVTIGDETEVLFGWEQNITIIWSGQSDNIKPTYKAVLKKKSGGVKVAKLI